MKKQMERMKVRIEQNLNRTEKSVVLSEELLKLEETIGCYKQVCTTLHKKLSEGLQGFGKGTDGGSIERRLKKSVDFSLGQSLTEQGRLLTKADGGSCLGQVLLEGGALWTNTGMNLVQYEISVEQLVLAELDSLLKTDLPNILSQRKQLDRLILELDTCKSRLRAAREEPDAGVRLERLGEELEDMERRVEQARDTLATEMMTFVARDAELAGLVGKYLEFRREYHAGIADQVAQCQPRVTQVLDSKSGFPVFGSQLSHHLQAFSIESRIAFPLQLCVVKLQQLGLQEEGLFRLAAGASKVKRLRAEIESGYASLASLSGSDHHVLTAVLKSYLRELPEPLLGSQLYSLWCEAGSLPSSEERSEAVWDLLQHDSLSRDNYRNIQFLFKFLHEVTLHSEENKMTASNLAIVITPNVIWECEATHDTMDVNVGNSLAQVVELIITQYDYFFQNDSPILDWSAGMPSSLLGRTSSTGGSSGSTASTGSSSSASEQSPVPQARERRQGKGKKAPAPPQGSETPGSPLSPVTLRRDSPLSSPRVKSHETRTATGDQGGESYPRSKSQEGGLRTGVATHPPSHPPPQPPNQQRDVEPHHNNSHQQQYSLYPDISQERELELEDSKEKSQIFPVPAPRFSKPALPSKPEGLTRNLSVRQDPKNGSGPGWSPSVTSKQSPKDSSSSTNL